MPLKTAQNEGYSSLQGKLCILTAVALPKGFTSIAVPSINHRILKRPIKVHTPAERKGVAWTCCFTVLVALISDVPSVIINYVVIQTSHRKVTERAEQATESSMERSDAAVNLTWPGQAREA